MYQRLPAADVLVVLPPLGARNGRYLCKRLRQSNSELRIVAALFNGVNLKNSRQRLQECGADVVVASLPEAVDAVHALARQSYTARSR